MVIVDVYAEIIKICWYISIYKAHVISLSAQSFVITAERLGFFVLKMEKGL